MTETTAMAATNRPVIARRWPPGADVVIMVHPDYQYTPLLITAMASMVAYDVYDVVLGSRIIGGQALHGGMPLYKYISNRFLTAFENLFLRVKLSEYHTGYRAFSRKVLTELPLLENSPDFVFDNQMLAQCVHFGFRIGEVSCPTKYFEEASSINFRRSVKYGLGVLGYNPAVCASQVGTDQPAPVQPGRKKAGGSTAGCARGPPQWKPAWASRAELVLADATERRSYHSPCTVSGLNCFTETSYRYFTYLGMRYRWRKRKNPTLRFGAWILRHLSARLRHGRLLPRADADRAANHARAQAALVPHVAGHNSVGLHADSGGRAHQRDERLFRQPRRQPGLKRFSDPQVSHHQRLQGIAEGDPAQSRHHLGRLRGAARQSQAAPRPSAWKCGARQRSAPSGKTWRMSISAE